MHVAAVGADAAAQPVQRFGPYTSELQRLSDWLRGCHVTSVVLEATGSYWIPVYDHLEKAGFEVVLVDPRSLWRHLRKKTDQEDAQSLQELHASGLLRGCFRPSEQVRQLRTLWRQRSHLVSQSAMLAQMIQKVLIQMNVHLHLAVSDVMGVTGLRILRTLVGGERNPAKLAAMREPTCHKSETEIAQALEGVWDASGLFELKQHLQAWDFYQKQIHELDQELEKLGSTLPDRSEGQPLPPTSKRDKNKSTPDFDARQMAFQIAGVDLTQVEGVHVNTVLAVLSETGAELSSFRSGRSFAAWTGLAPREHQSGKRHWRPKYPAQGANRVAKALRLAAQAVKKANTYLGAFYRRMLRRGGPGFAIRCTACKLARLFWSLLTHRQPYDQHTWDNIMEKQHLKRLKALKKAALEFGCQLVPLAS